MGGAPVKSSSTDRSRQEWKLVVGKTEQELSTDVTALRRQGWDLEGNHCMAYSDGNGWRYSQALTRVLP